MRRFFVPKEQIPTITGPDVHHVRDVLRMKAGDVLELLDGSGMVYEVKIKEIKKKEIVCAIVESREPCLPAGRSIVESRIKVTLAQALPKASKMDFIIEKCTELGVDRVIPMSSERTVAKSARIDRWQKIARSSAEQSRRTTIPEISPLTSFEEVLKMKKQFNLALILWEEETETTLKQTLSNYLMTGYPDILVLVGPEGGFSQKEIDLAKEAGIVPVSLGRRILRTETAGMAVLSILMYELEQ